MEGAEGDRLPFLPARMVGMGRPVPAVSPPALAPNQPQAPPLPPAPLQPPPAPLVGAPPQEQQRRRRPEPAAREGVWQVVDDMTEPVYEGADEPFGQILARHWGAIRTKLRRQRVLDILNVRMWNGEEPETVEEDVGRPVWEMLRRAWSGGGVRTRLKLNCSVGVVLKHKETGELRYFHSSSNNATVFDAPRVIGTERQLRDFYDSLVQTDLRAHSSNRRPNTAWQLLSVTNITFYMYKMLGMGRIGTASRLVTLPSFITSNKNIMAMAKDRRGVPYDDNLCLFRCLSVVLNCKCVAKKCTCRESSPGPVKALFERYSAYMSGKGREIRRTWATFGGVGRDNLLDIESCFGVNVVVMCLDEDGTSSVEWASLRRQSESGTTVYLNLYESHFSLIRNVCAYAKAYVCKTCDACYSRCYSLTRHTCPPEKASRFMFDGGVFGSPETIFSLISRLTGIRVTDPELLYYPYVITYDIECFLSRDRLPANTPTTSFESRHELLSISVCSNIPGHTDPVCFIRDSHSSDPRELIEEFVAYINEAAGAAGGLMAEKFESLREEVERFVQFSEAAEKSFAEDEFSLPGVRAQRQQLGGVLKKLDKHISTVPVVGFNSSRYDLPILKGLLFQCVQAIKGGDLAFVVKRVNAMTCVESKRFRFLDIMNFIAPGFSYEKYLKAYDCSLAKGYFPYEWMDSLEKLKHTSLPPREAFYSSLVGKGITEENYALCQRAWEEEEMSTFADFVRWYNNLDVVPFVEALEKQASVYRQKGIDMLKSAVSLPGLAVHWLFKVVSDPRPPPNREAFGQRELREYLRARQPVILLDSRNSDLYDVIKSGVVGGPAIIFHRYHEKGKTNIRQHCYGEEARPCQRVLGVDANALYLHCLGESMPSGYPSRWVFKAETDVGPERCTRLSTSNRTVSKVALGWLEYISFSRGIDIRHARNGGEVRLGQHNLPVDGYCEETRTAFQFNGCYWHGHPCSKNPDVYVNAVRQMDFGQLYRETLRKENYLRELGYEVETIWECEWEERVRADGRIKAFLCALFATLFPNSLREGDSLECCVDKIRSGRFYGLVECDIRVPPELEEKFSEMAPIFKNVEVGREHLSEHMRSFAEGTSFLVRPQRMLVGSLYGERILLLSELARWYLEHGLEVTRIYQMVEYLPRRTFSEFTLSVSDARRAGDVNPDMMLLADTSKLIGNSAYGKTITNKEKHRKVKYVSGAKNASREVSNQNFRALTEIADDYFEVETSKSRVSRYHIALLVND